MIYPVCLLDFAAASHDRPCLPTGFRRRISRSTLYAHWLSPSPPIWITLTLAVLYLAPPGAMEAMALLCAYCHSAVNIDDPGPPVIYRVSELGLEFNAIIEETLHREVDENGILCTDCFNIIADLLNQELHQVVEIDGSLRTGRCVWCNRPIARLQTHILEEGLIYNEVAVQISPREIPQNGCICHACWMAARRNVARQAQIDQRRTETSPVQETPMRYGSYKRTPNSASRCFVCGCINTDLASVPLFLKHKLLSQYKLYVMPLARVCREHLSIYNWDFLNEMEYITGLTQSEIVAMLQLLSNTKITNTVMNFENIDQMSESNINYWIGLTKLQYLNLLVQIGDDFLNIKNHKTLLAIFLMKLRTGEPNVRLAQLLDTSEWTASRMLKKCCLYMLERYVPLHLGINNISRNDLINRNLIIPEGLFGRKPITNCDGTYLYLQKSSNYLFQKKTYSLHKYRNLVKPFLMVATDGHIIDVFGPYAATTSDADIIKQLFQSSETHLTL